MVSSEENASPSGKCLIKPRIELCQVVKIHQAEKKASLSGDKASQAEMKALLS
jgi:hypothetical protein